MATVASEPASGVPDGGHHDSAQWLKRHGPALRSYFRRRANASDVDDLMQEVLLKVQAAAISSEVRNSESYMFTVARNVLISRSRSEKVRNGEAFETYALISGGEGDFSPERILIARDEYARAREAILALPPRTRAAFQFHRFEGMTYAQIAETMGISKETVKDLMQRAMRGIVARLADTEKADV